MLVVVRDPRGPVEIEVHLLPLPVSESVRKEKAVYAY